MKRYVKASYKEEFESRFNKAILNKQAMIENSLYDLGILSQIRNGSATEDEYMQALEVVDSIVDLSDIMESVVSAIRGMNGVESVEWRGFSDDPIYITTSNGYEYSLEGQFVDR